MAIKVTVTLPLHSCQFLRHFLTLSASCLIPGKYNGSSCFTSSEYITRYLDFKAKQSNSVSPRCLGKRRVSSWPQSASWVSGGYIFLPGHKEMKGLRTWRNLSETTAPLEIRPKTRELRWGECRDKRQKVPSAQQTWWQQWSVSFPFLPLFFFHVLYSSRLCSSLFSSHLFVFLMGNQPVTSAASHPHVHFVSPVYVQTNSIALSLFSKFTFFHYLGQIQFKMTRWLPKYLSPAVTSSSIIWISNFPT